jgi:hypothetical protein
MEKKARPQSGCGRAKGLLPQGAKGVRIATVDGSALYGSNDIADTIEQRHHLRPKERFGCQAAVVVRHEVQENETAGIERFSAKFQKRFQIPQNHTKALRDYHCSLKELTGVSSSALGIVSSIEDDFAEHG